MSLRLVLALVIASLMWVALPQSTYAQSPSLTCGSTVTATISDANWQNSWTFTASAGQHVQFNMTVDSALDTRLRPYLYLYTPGGNHLIYNYSSGSTTTIDYTFTEAGTYSLHAQRESETSTDTGTYSLTVRCIAPDATVYTDSGPLTCGGEVSGSLDDANWADRWAFTASAGQNVQFKMTADIALDTRLRPYLYLYTPGGNHLIYNYSSSSTTTIDYTFQQAGTYVLHARRESPFAIDVGTYTLTARCIVPEAEAHAKTESLWCGGEASGSLDDANWTDRWAFTASAGQNVQFKMTADTALDTRLRPYLYLYTPGGNNLTYNYSSSSSTTIDYTFQQAGTYILHARRESPFATDVGTYTLTARCIVSEAVTLADNGVLTCGSTVAGVINDGNWADLWRLAAPADLTITLTMTVDAALDTRLRPYLYLYTPGGNNLTYNYSSSNSTTITAYTLSEAGVYRIHARRDSPFSTDVGSYSLNLVCEGGSGTPPPIEAGGMLAYGLPVSGSIAPNEKALWSFTGQAGDWVSLRLRYRDWLASVSLLDANGQMLLSYLVDGGSFDAEGALVVGPYVLPADATYSVAIIGLAGTSGAYNLEVMTTSLVLDFTQPQTSSIVRVSSRACTDSDIFLVLTVDSFVAVNSVQIVTLQTTGDARIENMTVLAPYDTTGELTRVVIENLVITVLERSIPFAGLIKDIAQVLITAWQDNAQPITRLSIQGDPMPNARYVIWASRTHAQSGDLILHVNWGGSEYEVRQTVPNVPPGMAGTEVLSLNICGQ